MYYLLYGIFWLISLIPLRIFYLFADVVYVLIFYVFKYRRKVVLDNLAHAFPEKTGKERMRIAKDFYHNLVDTFIETIKMFSVGRKFFNRHCSADYTLLYDMHKKGVSFQTHAGHQFNWEWLNQHLAIHAKQPLVAVYMPMSNKTFEKIFFKVRSRYGTVMLPATDMKNSFIPWRTKEHMLVLVADQNPGNPGNSYWFNFFGRPTPFIKGPERSAREKACPVIFGFVKKIKRGHYHTDFTLVTEDASALPETELTRQYVSFLSKVIREQPAMWLWSHRRWKWQWDPSFGPILDN